MLGAQVTASETAGDGSERPPADEVIYGIATAESAGSNLDYFRFSTPSNCRCTQECPCEVDILPKTCFKYINFHI